MSALNLSNVSGKAVLASTFSRGAYDSKTPFVPPAGFEPLEVKLVNPQSPDFAASAYVNPKTGELVVAYRGSDSSTDLSTALQGAANGKWSGQFTDAAAYMKQAQGMAAKVVDDYSKLENITDAPKITTLTTGHSLGGMLAQVVAKMYGVEAQVQDAPGAARLIDTPQFKQAAIANGQPESGHDITGKVQNVTTSNIAKLGKQFEETQVVAIPALGQMGGLDALATLGAFLANPVAGLATGTALQTAAEHSAVKIEDALHMLAGIKGQVADAGALTLQPMYLDRDGKPVAYAPADQGDAATRPTPIQALVDKGGKVVAFFDREVVDGEMQAVAVVVGSGNRIHLARTQDASSPQVVETTVHGERRVISQTELLTSLQDSRGTPALTPEAQEVNDALLDAFKSADQAAADLKAQYPGVQVADAGGGLSGATAQNNANSFSNFLDTQGSSLTPAQQTALAAQVNSLGLGGEGDLSFYSLPGGGALIANADGDIVGEVVQSNSGDLRLRATGIDTDGNTVEVSQHISESGQSLSDAQYSQQQLTQLSAGLGLVNNLQSLQNWGDLNDLSRLSTLVSTYNNLSNLSAGASGFLGDLGPLSGGLGLLAALDSGNAGAAIVSGISLINTVADDMANKAIGAALGMNTANVMPGLNLLLALDSGDPLSVLSAAASFIPVWGPLISLGIGLLGSLFGDDDIPMREGLAHAQWDAHGHTQVVTTQDAEGGGATASSWMNSLVSGLQTRLDQTVDANGQAQYGLVPGLLPSVGFKYDPDGFNLANGAKGFMYLQWTDENGQTQTRYYDGAGDRGDGSGETLAGDFMQHAQGAIAPAWQVQTVLAHYQQTGQLDLPEQSSSLPTELAGGLQQTLQVVSLALPNALPSESTPNNTLIDVDGDGYLEKTQWLQSNQAVLAVDLNGDGQISVGERVSLQGAGQAAQTRTSMGWLDANGDGRLTAQDPAFAALKLWIDVNQDGQSQNGEVQSVSQAGITAMDFSTNPPSIERADGSQQALMVQDLTADTLGVALQQTAGGMVETTEQQDGSGRSVLHAVNTREFDGQAAHTHGGDQDVDGSNGQVVQVDDSRLATTTNNTIANSSTQTSTTVGVGDSRLRSAAPLTATVITTTNNANNTRVVFVPAGQTSAQKEIVSVTNSMIESAQSSLFGESAGSSFAGPGVLTAVSMGATVSAASAANAAEAADVAQGSVSNVSTSNTPAAASASSDAVSWTQVNLGGSALPKQPSNTGPSNTSNTSSTSIISTATTTSSTAPVAGLGSTSGASTEPLFVWATVITSANSISSNSTTANATTPTSPLPIAASTAPSVDTSVAASSLSLGYPVVQAETLQGTEDVVLRLTQSVLLANDSTPNASADLNAPALTITAVSQPLHGQVSLVNGEVLFTPDSNFHGTASFTYTVTDQYGLSTNSTATLEIAAVNDAPVAQGELVSSDEDIGLIFTQAQLLTNDTDVDVATDGQVLTISRVGLAEHGTVLLDALGQVRFVPDLNYNGPAQFTYWISDGLAANGAGAEVPATVNLTILAVNDVPVVTGETVNTNEDTTLLFNPATLLANDTDVDVATNGQVLSITAVNNATHGTVAFVTQSDGSQRIAFTPEANFFGMASYQYTVSDGNGGTATTTVVVNLAAVNDAPDVVADTLSATEDTPLSWVQNALLANDSDVDNPHTDLRIVGVSNATHGSVSLNPDGSIRFEPELDYFGAATFNYTVGDGVGGFSVGTATVNIAPVNDNPVAVGESLTLNEDEVATLSVASLLTNDTDVDNAHVDLSIQSVGNATHGSVSLVTTNGTTSVVFKPELNFNGIASFTYTVSDGVGGTATTSMRLDFTSVNDLPVVNNELFMGKRNVNYSLSTAALLANDIDVETSTANLTVASVGNAQHGTVSLVNGNVVFVPEAGYSGRGSFDYVVQDADGGQSTATTQIDFSRINVNPVAVDDSFNGFEDVPLSITQAQLLVNDSDSDNASLHVSHLGSATNGTVAFDAQGNVVFTPDANFYGQASFTYQVSDGDGGSTWATASLSVASVNDAPIIEDVWYGRPIYGYKWYANVSTDEQGSYTGHWWTLEPVTSESEARALQANPNDLVYAVGVPNWPWVTDLSRRNDLMNSAGAVLPPSYYLNGQIKPIAFNSLDAAAVDEYGSVVSISNDAYRQNGSVVAYDPDGDSSALTFSIGSTPTHGHAWANQYTSLYAPEQLDHTQAGAYWSTEKGAWQYYSSRGDTYNGTDSFQVSVRDSAGASTSVTVNATHTGSSHAGGGGKKPVTLDLNGDGLQYIGLDDSKAYFDVNDDGWRERMAWVGAGDGLLALDTQGDHTIDKWNEISFVSYKEGARSDLEGLQAFDSSGNGKLDRLDARWNEFGAWVDANANGVCETGEFKTLDELRIVSIDLTSDQQVASPVFGVTELGQSKFTTADGKTHAVGDVVFAVDAHDRLPSRVLDGLALQRPEPGQEAVLQKSDADRHLAEVIRQAMLFNQMVNTVIVSNEPPLSFVANELLTQDWRQIELQGAVDPFSAPRVSAS